MQIMKTALVQMRVRTDNDENIRVACEQIAEAAANGADLVVLPEMFCCPYQTANFPIYAQPERGSNWQALSDCARRCKVYLVAGSMPELDSGKVYNTSYVFDRSGSQIAKHRKMHLFDIDVKGGQRFFESETLTAGNSITLFTTEFGVMGLVICFDLRFPELSRLLTNAGARALVVPAAFNMTTGPAHWELHFRARALDNQIFTIGCAPAHDPDSSYHSYGNSIVASPWGDVVARLDGSEQLLYCDIDMAYVDDVRQQLPLLSARRTDVYELVYKLVE